MNYDGVMGFVQGFNEKKRILMIENEGTHAREKYGMKSYDLNQWLVIQIK